MSRAWGFWTRQKFYVRDYLDAFTTTTKYKADERIYLACRMHHVEKMAWPIRGCSLRSIGETSPCHSLSYRKSSRLI